MLRLRMYCLRMNVRFCCPMRFCRRMFSAPACALFCPAVRCGVYCLYCSFFCLSYGLIHRLICPFGGFGARGGWHPSPFPSAYRLHVYISESCSAARDRGYPSARAHPPRRCDTSALPPCGAAYAPKNARCRVRLHRDICYTIFCTIGLLILRCWRLRNSASECPGFTSPSARRIGR